MARFNFNAPASSNNGQDESWKAQAFLNVWINDPTSGKRIKIGAIPLREQVATHADLIEAMKQPGAVDGLNNAVEIDFQMANRQGEKNRFGFLANSATAQANPNF